MDRSPGTHFDYVTIGHVTCDAIEHAGAGATRQAGGSAFYSALQAARLGLRTLVVTQGVPDEIEALLDPYRDELELRVIAAEHTTTLRTRGTGAARTQRMLAWAGPIAELVEIDAAILHLAPVARETPVAWRGHAGFVGITPQGLVRRWELDGDVRPAELDPALLPASFHAAVISEQERHSSPALFTAARRHGACVAVTADSRPTTIHLAGTDGGSLARTPLPPTVSVREDVGAGDVFAATFFVALAEGRAPLEAATLANAAASIRIARTGPDAVGDREQIERVREAQGLTP